LNKGCSKCFCQGTNLSREGVGVDVLCRTGMWHHARSRSPFVICQHNEHAEDESQVGFHEVATVLGVNRGFGAWGDMVVGLSNGDKLELRSVPKCVASHVFWLATASNRLFASTCRMQQNLFAAYGVSCFSPVPCCELDINMLLKLRNHFVWETEHDQED
jgi:hypothetical protein